MYKEGDIIILKIKDIKREYVIKTKTTENGSTCGCCSLRDECSKRYSVVDDKGNTHQTISTFCVANLNHKQHFRLLKNVDNDDEWDDTIIITQKDIIEGFCKSDMCPFIKEPIKENCFKGKFCPLKNILK